MAITLLKHIRSASGGSVGKGAKFPAGLSDIRYVGIKIFDTSKGDPNKKIAGAAGSVVDGLKNAFSESAGGDLGGMMGKVAVSVNSVLNEHGSAITASLDSMKDYGKNFEDAGNPGLEKTWKDTIWLPLPNNLTEDLSHNYEEKPGLIDTIGQAASAAINTVIPGAPAGGVGGALSAHTGASNIVSMATGRQKLLYNENKMVQFTSSSFRSITLSWTLIPNNHEESLAIQEIITKLKAYSSPQHVASKLLLRAPFFCKLEFPNSYINEALQFNEVVMTNIQVNYSVTNAMETFAVDNMPKTMHLSITFKDREPKTLQNWAEGEKGYESAGHK